MTQGTQARPRALSAEEARRLRSRAQHLAPCFPADTDLAGRVAALGALPAQDSAAPALALRARSPDSTAGAVAQALDPERTLVRTWLMRGTLHVLAAADLGWLLGLYGPINRDGDARRRRQLGLDDETARRGVDVICAALTGAGPLPRAALADALAAAGLPAAGQAPVHLLGLAAAEGRVVLGPDAGAKPTYVLLEEWLPHIHAELRPDAAQTLAACYLAAYGPADAADFAAWAGLPRACARAAWDALGGEALPVTVAGRPTWLAAAQVPWLDARAPADPVVRLVPGFDPLLLGYRSRDWLLAPDQARHIHPGGGILHPAVLVDGVAVARWHLTRAAGRAAISVAPFAATDAAVRDGIAAEVEAIGRFLGVPITWTMTR